jgi:tRNA pseudouridine55 synthase
MDMIVAINKPIGPTSHDIVNQIRQITGGRRVGHAGTLDPLASGVLVIGIGKATKELGTFMKHEKEYLALIKLGQTSTTDDAEGEKIKMSVHRVPPVAEIQASCNCLQGEIIQVPPIYSAVKVAGREAYKYARSGQIIQMKPRTVTIKHITILKYRWPNLLIEVECGPGVYIRSLARDIGATLKTGGYLAALKRTRVGQFTLDQSLTLEQFKARYEAAQRMKI